MFFFFIDILKKKIDLCGQLFLVLILDPFDKNTIVHNEKGSPIPQDNLKTKTWVFVEAVKDKSQKKLATKIYLLPKYIDDKEKHLYPFIK